jgi:hypothetical protein
LTNNWTNLIRQNIQHPKSVAEAVDRLMTILDNEQKATIGAVSENDLIELHFGLGLAIRNGFGLHDQGSELLASCGAVNPDDASATIIKALWYQINKI